MIKEAKRKIGVIGGTGLYKLKGLTVVEEKELNTPFGKPSDKFIIANAGDVEVVFLARHGKHHTILPAEINYRANIYALKMLGIEQIVSIAAVGSFKEELPPGSLGLVSQFVDRTHSRKRTFFGNGFVGHITFADPVCPHLSDLIYSAAKEENIELARNLTYVCIEGPQFNSRAESEMYRSFGWHVVGMTNDTEARLAREAEICYASLITVTDYDSWHVGEQTVSVEQVLATIKKNQEVTIRILSRLIPKFAKATCDNHCASAASGAFVTMLEHVPTATLKNLEELYKKYY